MKMFKTLGLTLAVAGLLGGSASAIPLTLTLSDGIAPPIVVTDGGAGDVNAGSGAVTYIGGVGVWTSVQVNTGYSYPAVGSTTAPQLDLSFSGLSNAAGTLTLTLSDMGYTYTGGLTDQWGGTTTGSVINRVLLNGQAVITQGAFGPGAFSSSAVNQFVLIPTDTLALQVQITHNGVGTTTGDKHLLPVPDGGTSLVLLGLGLLSLIAVRRKA